MMDIFILLSRGRLSRKNLKFFYAIYNNTTLLLSGYNFRNMLYDSKILTGAVS